MAERSKFPADFWVANLIELLERYAYQSICFGFGIYLASLGSSRDQLGIIQSLCLFFSYLIPVVTVAVTPPASPSPSPRMTELLRATSDRPHWR